MQFAAQRPDLCRGRVVALMQLPIRHHAGAQARSQRDAQQVLVAKRAPALFQRLVRFRQRARQRFPIREKIRVIPNKDRKIEMMLQHRSQRHPIAAESGQVVALTNNAQLVVRWSRKADRDRRGFTTRTVVKLLQSPRDLIKTGVELVAVRRQRERLANNLSVFHRGKNEIRPTCIEGENEGRGRYGALDGLSQGINPSS